MVVVMNRLSASAEFAGRIEQGFAHAAPGMQDVPGFVAFRLLHLRDGQDGQGGQALYIAETTWRDQTSYEAWARSDAFARAHGGGGSPLTATLETFEVVDAPRPDDKAP